MKINGYRKLTYIQSDGNQIIHTGVQYSTTIKCKLKYTQTSGATSHLYILGTTNGTHYYGLQARSGDALQTYYASGTNADTISNYQRIDVTHEIEFESGKIVIDGNETSINSFVNNSISLPISVFGRNNSSASSQSRMPAKLYYFKMYDGSTLISDLIPVERESDNVLGLYDLVNNVFYANNGSGTFTKGDYLLETNVNPLGSGTVDDEASGNSHLLTATKNSGYKFVNWLLNGYTQLEYIESTGTQYIDVGLKGNMNTSVEMSINQQSNSTNNTICLFGDGTDGTSSIQYILPTNTSTRTSRFGAKSFTYSTPTSVNENHIIKINKTNLMVDDVIIGVFNTTSSFTTSADLTIFKCNGVASGYYNGTSRIYYVKIYDNGTLVRDYIPVVRHIDAQVGLYDLVEHKFYGNSGTGTFIGGNEV